MHNGEIVSYDISTSPNFKQTLRMLEIAFKKPGNEDLNNLVLQSEQGWQYQMRDYHKSLKEKGIIQSMSRKGNCLDNSIIENFFGVMKKEMFYGQQHEFITLKDLEQAMEEYIEYYNTQRIKVKLKGLAPVRYRRESLML